MAACLAPALRHFPIRHRARRMGKCLSPGARQASLGWLRCSSARAGDLHLCLCLFRRSVPMPSCLCAHPEHPPCSCSRSPLQNPFFNPPAARLLSAPDASRTYRDYPWSPRWAPREMAARIHNWLQVRSKLQHV